MRFFALMAFSIAHALDDGYTNMVPPLLPVFAALYNLNKAELGTLMLALTIPANFLQPVFGLFLDRHRYRGSAALGLLLALLGIAWMALGHSVAVLALGLLVAGLGTALFHPAAGSWVGEIGGEKRRTTAFSVFSSVGAVGYAGGAVAGPLLYKHYGMEGLVWAVVIALAWALVVFAAERQQDRTVSSHGPLGEMWDQRHGLGSVVLTTTLRSATIGAFSMFLPLLIVERGQSLMAGGGALFGFLLASSVGLALGGAADRWGRRRLTLVSLVVGAPMLAVGSLLPGVSGLGLLWAGALIVRLGEPGNIAQTQEILTGGAGTAVGMAMGLSWGFAGLIYPVVGALADALGTHQALVACAGLCLLAALAAVTMPETKPAKEVRY